MSEEAVNTASAGTKEPADEDLILELKGITKIFPGVKALDNVHFHRSG